MLLESEEEKEYQMQEITVFQQNIEELTQEIAKYEKIRENEKRLKEFIDGIVDRIIKRENESHKLSPVVNKAMYQM